MAAEAAFAEQVGFDEVWVPDTPLFYRENWVTLTSMALGTSRVKLGPCVTNPVIRDPSVVACAISSLDELSQGRAILGLGAGDAAVRMIDRRPARLERLHQAVTLIRSYTAGEWVPCGDRKVRMKTAEERRSSVPIYLAASKPKMLQLAGELADGVFLVTGMDRGNIQRALEDVRTGAARADRSLDELEVILGVHCHVGEDWGAVKKQARPFCAHFIEHAPDALRAVGIPVPEMPPMPKLYPNLHHAEDWEQAIAVTEWIPDEVLEQFCEKYTLTGNATRVIQRLEQAVEQGIHHFFILGFSSYRLPHELTEVFAKQVIPYFKD